MNADEDGNKTDFVSREPKTSGVFKKFLISLVSVIVLVIGELVKWEDNDLRK